MGKTKKTAAPALDISSEEIALEWARCSLDPVYSINTYAVILVRQDDGSRSITPFTLWDYQTKLVIALARGGHFMILKARQLGITTVVCAYLAWFAIFRPGSFVLVLSKREDEAQKLLERIRTTYERFPPWLREIVPKGETWNNTTLTFQNGSTVQSIAATEGAGRSETASVVFVDEADFIPDLKATYQAVKPTVDGPGGQMILASTSQGPLRFFRELFDEAVQKKGKLRAIFFPWDARPGRTEEWLEREAGDLSPHQRRREYPRNTKDAFSSADDLVYNSFDVTTHMDTMIYDAATRVVHTARYGDFRVSYCAAGQDWNTAVPGCLLVGAVATDGTILIVDGHYEANLPIVSEDPDMLTWTKMAREFHKHYRLQQIAADWQPDAIQSYVRSGLPAQKATKDVASGIANIIALLNIRKDTGKPGIIFNSTLDFLAHEFFSYKHRRVGGILTDIVVKQDDHGLDACRYLCSQIKRGTPSITIIR